LGLQLSRQQFVLAVAIVVATIFGTLFMAGPALAGAPEVVAASSLGSSGAAPKADALNYQAKQPASSTAGVAQGTPQGSPLPVQITTIAILLVLGAGYFRVMGQSGRRTPATRTERADVA
jgi:hypothetical protein